MMQQEAQQTAVEPAPAQAETLLSVNNIEVIYDHVILVLKGVSLQVPEGGIVALLGANGAGKTTTLKAVSNLLRAEAWRGHQGVHRVQGRSRPGTHPQRPGQARRGSGHGGPALF